MGKDGRVLPVIFDTEWQARHSAMMILLNTGTSYAPVEHWLVDRLRPEDA